MFLALDPRRLPASSLGATRFDRAHRDASQKAKSRYSCQRHAGSFYSGEFGASRDVNRAPGYRLDPRPDSDRQAADRGPDRDRGAGGADSDRTPDRTTRAAAHRLAVDLGADPVPAAVRAHPAAVAVMRGAVIGVVGPDAEPVRIRRSPAGGHRALADADRGVADHPAGEGRSRPEPVPVDARGEGRARPARSAPVRAAAAGGRVARAGARPAA